jgi:hypothetical protein
MHKLFSVGIPEGNRPLGRPARRLKHNILNGSTILKWLKVKSKGKVHPVTFHEGTEGK